MLHMKASVGQSYHFSSLKPHISSLSTYSSPTATSSFSSSLLELLLEKIWRDLIVCPIGYDAFLLTIDFSAVCCIQMNILILVIFYFLRLSTTLATGFSASSDSSSPSVNLTLCLTTVFSFLSPSCKCWYFLAFYLWTTALNLFLLPGEAYWMPKLIPPAFSYPSYWWTSPRWACMHACLLSHFSCVSLWPCGLKPTRLLCPWVSLAKNTGVGFHLLLQGIFLTRDQTWVSYLSCTGRLVLDH